MKKKLLKLLRKILAIFTRIYLRRTESIVIGITGNVGKTSCRMIITGILKKYLQDKKIYTSNKNFNSELGLIFSVFKISIYTPGIISLIIMSIKIIFKSIFGKKEYDILVLEYGVDHPGDMDFLLRICKPDYSIFTKLDKIHSCYFNTPNGIGDEKIKLILATGKKAYLNPKDDFCKKIFSDLKVNKEFFPKVDNYSLNNDEGKLISVIKSSNYKIKTNLIGIENAEYIVLGLKIFEDLSNKSKKITEDFINLSIQSGRFSIFEGINGSILIDSTYNTGPESMKKMIKNTFFIREKIFPNYKIILVLGDMRELKDSIVEEEHKKLYEFVKYSNVIYTVGKEMVYLVEKLKEKSYKGILKSYIKSKEAGKGLKEYLNKSDSKHIILFKGSQNTIFIEEALKEVLKNNDDKTKLVRQSKDWMIKKY